MASRKSEEQRAPTNRGWKVAIGTGTLLFASLGLVPGGVFGCSHRSLTAIEQAAGAPDSENSGGAGQDSSGGSSLGGPSVGGDQSDRGGHGTVSGGGYGNAGGVSGFCVHDGERCTNDIDCCSGLCDRSVCQSAALTCASAGDPCTTTTSCCSLVCGADGRCAPQDCHASGASCVSNADCCSSLCGSIGNSERACIAADGCRPIGDSCAYGPDCCSGHCGDWDPSQNEFRCIANLGCLESGDICSADVPCCQSQGADSKSVCSLASGLGINRCMAIDLVETCLEDGEHCAQGTECCGGYCLPSEVGGRSCASSCVQLGGRCASNFDCCGNAICPSGACVPNPSMCAPLGVSCATNTDCCDGNCSDSLHRCIAP